MVSNDSTINGTTTFSVVGSAVVSLLLFSSTTGSVVFSVVDSVVVFLFPDAIAKGFFLLSLSA